MSNKIGGIEQGGPVSTGRAATSKRDTSSAPGGQSGSASPAGDVHITESAALLAGAEQVAQTTQVIDAGRVAAASRALASGNYSIDAQKVAGGLLRSEQWLAQLGAAEG
jgi:flagellar biosynthesis anti-sigma factor FlgM